MRYLLVLTLAFSCTGEAPPEPQPETYPGYWYLPNDVGSWQRWFPERACLLMSTCETQLLGYTREECVATYQAYVDLAVETEPCFSVSRMRSCFETLDSWTGNQLCEGWGADTNTVPHQCFKVTWAEPCEPKE